MTRINITDDMIERAAKAVDREVAAASAYARDTDTWMCWNNEKIARVALEAALDRRTGPKDRRVEWDDTPSNPMRRIADTFGRRRDDAIWHALPRKSDRLKREAAAWRSYEEQAKDPEIKAKMQRDFDECVLRGLCAEEIHVSEGMIRAGMGELKYRRCSNCADGIKPVGYDEAVAANAYRAMRLQEMKERGQ